jgi:hypothetical protein
MGLFGLRAKNDAARARAIVQQKKVKNEPVTARELAAADPHVVLDSSGKVKLPETIANMRRDGLGPERSPCPAEPVARENYFNFRSFAEKQGPAGFVGVPDGVDVRTAARLRTIDPQPVDARLETLSWEAFVADLKSRTPGQLRAALDELDGLSAQLDSLARDLAPSEPAARQLRTRLDHLFSRQQLILQALESPTVLDHA